MLLKTKTARSLFDPTYWYALQKYAFEVDFHNLYRAGTLLKHINHENRIEKIGSDALGLGLVADAADNPVLQVSADKYQPGDHLPLTTDLNDEPGTVLV